MPSYFAGALIRGARFRQRQPGNQFDANDNENQSMSSIVGDLLLSHVLPNFSSLGEVDFSGSYFFSFSINRFNVLSLRGVTDLIPLKTFAGAKLGDERMSEVMDLCRKMIAACKTLRLAKNSLRDSFVRSLKLILGDSSCSIQSIDLSGNQLSEAAIPDLISCLGSYGRLESVDLRDSGRSSQLYSALGMTSSIKAFI